MAAYNGNSERLLVNSATKAATHPKKFLSAASGSAIPWGKL
jgi:hypothetical protein